MDRGNFILRDYQQDIVSRVLEAWERHRSVMVQMPTGTGKTHVLAAIVKSLTPGPSPRERGVDTLSGCDGGYDCNYVDNHKNGKKHITPLSLGEGSGVRLSPVLGEGSGERPVWIVAHRRELVAQIEETIQKMYAETVSADTVSADFKSAEADSSLFVLPSSLKSPLPTSLKGNSSLFILNSSFIRVLSIQWLSRHWDDVEGEPSLVIIDEAHHAVAETYKEMWRRLPRARFLGLTATPCRMNHRGFADLFDTLITSWSVAEFIEKKYLSAFDYVSIRQGSEEQRLIDSLEKRGADGDYQVKEMNAVLNRNTSIGRLYQSMEKYARGKKGIIYAISIDHARRIAEYYNSKGIGTAVIDSRTPAEERRRIVEEFRRSLTPAPSPRERGVDTVSKCDGSYNGNEETEEKHITPLSFGEGAGVRLPGGRLSVLVNVDVFSEGFDCPDVEFIQLARPTLSLAKYLQQVGRGLRKSEGKEACVIIDNVGLYRVFGLPTVAWDWQAMFQGRMAGKGSAANRRQQANAVPCMADSSLASIRHNGGMQGVDIMQDTGDMEVVVSHTVLLEAIENRETCGVTPHLPARTYELKAWQDVQSGLWGLKRGQNRTTEARYITVFDIRYDMAAVRFRDMNCGIVNDKGETIWQEGHFQSMKFQRHHLLKAIASDGREYYTDLYNLRVYDSKPEIKQYGNIELLKTNRAYHSRTKVVYANNQGISERYIIHRKFYLAVFDCKVPFTESRTEYGASGYRCGYACILSGDYDSYYWLYRRLADGSIIVKDTDGQYYHVADGKGKLYLGNEKSEAEYDLCKEKISRMEKDMEEGCVAVEAEKERQRRQLLDGTGAATPFRSGMKWGLKVGNRITVPPIYHNVKPPVGGYCVVEKNYSQWGVIAIDGTVLVEPKYPEISIADNGTALLTSVTGKTFSVKL